MPSKRILEQKEQRVADLVAKLEKSACGVLSNYKGINVADDTKFRKAMRDAGIDYFVIKNSLLSRAFEKTGMSELNEHLVGETAIALSEEDIIIAPKLVYGQVESSKGKYAIKAGFIDGKPVDSAVIIEYAKLPSKEVLVSKLLFMLQSPMQRLAIALSEIAKKGGETAEPAAEVAEEAPAEVTEAPAEVAEPVAEVVEEAPAETAEEAPVVEEAAAEAAEEAPVSEEPAE